MSEQMTMGDWYLAQTKANSHLIAERHLTRQGFDVFLPMTRVTQRRGPRFVSRQRPLFPGYLFVREAPGSAPPSAIGHTIGVLRRVVVAGRPARVPDDLVKALRAFCVGDEPPDTPANDLPVGSRVRIAHGPFADFIARVERAHPDGRVAVLLEVAGQHHRLKLDRTQLGLKPE
ncbi:transcriptional activator RfaH [Maritimibacter sp.]|uniref:transcription termination/antitermination protein NusG n=1 Tax=Maritimibacter sp. TaxID=2003363 RepID=UPI00257CA07A|nr:transcriptional activator RfaH [Maritimibacter sp.]